MDINLSASPRIVDFHAFAHPAATFSHPEEVLRDDTLSRAEKRIILSSWASDAHAVESRPWLRLVPGGEQPVTLAAILAALRRLDGDEPPPDRGMAIRLSDLARAAQPPADCRATRRGFRAQRGWRLKRPSQIDCAA